MVGCAEFAKKLAQQEKLKKQQKKSKAERAVEVLSNTDIEQDLQDPWAYQSASEEKREK